MRTREPMLPINAPASQPTTVSRLSPSAGPYSVQGGGGRRDPHLFCCASPLPAQTRFPTPGDDHCRGEGWCVQASHHRRSTAPAEGVGSRSTSRRSTSRRQGGSMSPMNSAASSRSTSRRRTPAAAPWRGRCHAARHAEARHAEGRIETRSWSRTRCRRRCHAARHAEGRIETVLLPLRTKPLPRGSRSTSRRRAYRNEGVDHLGQNDRAMSRSTSRRRAYRNWDHCMGVGRVPLYASRSTSRRRAYRNASTGATTTSAATESRSTSRRRAYRN